MGKQITFTFFELCQHEGGETVIGRHVGRLSGISKFAVDKLRSATPLKLSLLSTIEAVATLVKTVFLQYYCLRSLAGLLLR